MQIRRQVQGRTKRTEPEMTFIGELDVLDWIGVGSFNLWGGLDTDCSVRVAVVEEDLSLGTREAASFENGL